MTTYLWKPRNLNQQKFIEDFGPHRWQVMEQVVERATKDPSERKQLLEYLPIAKPSFAPGVWALRTELTEE